MEAMPRPRPPGLIHEKTRHGSYVWYYRPDKGPRIRIRGDYGSLEFTAAYRAAMLGQSSDGTKVAEAKGTVRWLVSRYQQSAAFLALAPSTQRMRGNVLKAICKTAGGVALARVDRKMMAEGRDRRAATPFAAITFLKTMSQLFDWAVDAGHMPSNPAKDVKRPSPKTTGFAPWTDEHIIAYCEAYPIGTRERLAMDLMLFTGLARSDAIMVGRQHVRDNVIEYRRTKTAAPIYIPILPPLAASLAATQTGDLAFLVTSRGTPWGSAASFGNTFSDWCAGAGLPVRAHGLRKRIATIMAEGGSTNSQLKAYFGWASDKMAAHYTKLADARAMALMASEGINVNTLSPHLEFGAGKEPKIPSKSAS